MRTALVLALLTASAALAQAPAGTSPMGQLFDNQISMVEREILGLAKKVPSEVYDFAPKTGTPPKGTFDGVRTFGVQVRHIATTMYNFAGNAAGEKPPVNTDGPDENGPTNLTTKDQSVAYLEGAIAYAHKVMRGLKADASQQQLAAAAFIAPHSYDHYGQMVVYARLNGVIPGGGPAPGPAKGKGKTK